MVAIWNNLFMKGSHWRVEHTVRAALIVVAIAFKWAFPLLGQTPSTPGHFIDATEQLGIRFRQQASPTSKKYLLETMGSGVALFDYDNDGQECYLPSLFNFASLGLRELDTSQVFFINNQGSQEPLYGGSHAVSVLCSGWKLQTHETKI
jgi:hypothetical protein